MASMSEEPSIEDFKIVVLGQPKVGKTSLVQRFVNNTFYHQVPQLPQEEKKRITLRNGKVVNLNIFDSADQAKVDILTKQFYSDSNAVVFVYSVMDEQTFYDVNTWIKDLEIYLNSELHQGLPILFVGNKKDQLVAGSRSQQPPPPPETEGGDDSDEESQDKTTISLRAVKNFIDQQRHKNYKFLSPKECSSLNGEGVDDVFLSVANVLADIPASERKKIPCTLL